MAPPLAFCGEAFGRVGVVDGLNGAASCYGWRRKRVTELWKLPSPACKGNAATGLWVNGSEWRLKLRLDFCVDHWRSGGGRLCWVVHDVER
ncbi:hypothetical protein NC651_026853 [Populus alba x Populus x berolinensis]|nr:hypothetical protein NC651_026853 [Populus alba x Populus x berolinensis]